MELLYRKRREREKPIKRNWYLRPERDHRDVCHHTPLARNEPHSARNPAPWGPGTTRADSDDGRAVSSRAAVAVGQNASVIAVAAMAVAAVDCRHRTRDREGAGT